MSVYDLAANPIIFWQIGSLGVLYQMASPLSSHTGPSFEHWATENLLLCRKCVDVSLSLNLQAHVSFRLKIHPRTASPAKLPVFGTAF